MEELLKRLEQMHIDAQTVTAIRNEYERSGDTVELHEYALLVVAMYGDR